MVIKTKKKIKFGNQVSIWDRKILKGVQLKMDLDSKNKGEKGYMVGRSIGCCCRVTYGN